MAFTYEVPTFSGLSSFTDWWNANSNKLTQERQQYYSSKYINPLNQLIGYNASTGGWDTNKWPTYNPVEWGSPSDVNSYAYRYQQQQTGLDALLARLAAGPQSSDMAAAKEMVAQSYGYSPASYTGIQEGMPNRLEPSTVMSEKASVAMGLEQSPFGQEQQRAMQLAARQAEAAVSKQLEAIFGERGGLAGFQAAYDMTSQLQSTFLQQQTQYHLGIFNQAAAAVDAENAYYQELVTNGAIKAQEYLQFRWDALQGAYQDYLVGMDQTMKDWQTQEQVAEAQYGSQAKVIQDQVNAITGALSAEMGVDQQTIDYATSLYNLNAQEAADKDAANQTSMEDRFGNARNWIESGPQVVLLAPVDFALGVAQGVSHLVGC